MIGSKFKKIALISCFVCISGLSYANSHHETSENTYQNQRGSVLKLKFDEETNHTGKLTGTFTTAVGDCQTDMNTPMPISGYYNGNAISLSVNFPHCNQVIAMTGYLINNKTQISTIALDAQVASDPLHKDWKSNIIATDLYNQIT